MRSVLVACMQLSSLTALSENDYELSDGFELSMNTRFLGRQDEYRNFLVNIASPITYRVINFMGAKFRGIREMCRLASVHGASVVRSVGNPVSMTFVLKTEIFTLRGSDVGHKSPIFLAGTSELHPPEGTGELGVAPLPVKMDTQSSAGIPFLDFALFASANKRRILFTESILTQVASLERSVCSGVVDSIPIDEQGLKWNKYSVFGKVGFNEDLRAVRIIFESIYDYIEIPKVTYNRLIVTARQIVDFELSNNVISNCDSTLVRKAFPVVSVQVGKSKVKVTPRQYVSFNPETKQCSLGIRPQKKAEIAVVGQPFLRSALFAIDRKNLTIYTCPIELTA